MLTCNQYRCGILSVFSSAGINAQKIRTCIKYRCTLMVHMFSWEKLISINPIQTIHNGWLSHGYCYSQIWSIFWRKDFTNTFLYWKHGSKHFMLLTLKASNHSSSVRSFYISFVCANSRVSLVFLGHTRIFSLTWSWSISHPLNFELWIIISIRQFEDQHKLLKYFSSCCIFLSGLVFQPCRVLDFMGIAAHLNML